MGNIHEPFVQFVTQQWPCFGLSMGMCYLREVTLAKGCSLSRKATSDMCTRLQILQKDAAYLHKVIMTGLGWVEANGCLKRRYGLIGLTKVISKQVTTAASFLVMLLNMSPQFEISQTFTL